MSSPCLSAHTFLVDLFPPSQLRPLPSSFRAGTAKKRQPRRTAATSFPSATPFGAPISHANGVGCRGRATTRVESTGDPIRVVDGTRAKIRVKGTLSTPPPFIILPHQFSVGDFGQNSRGLASWRVSSAAAATHAPSQPIFRASHSRPGEQTAFMKGPLQLRFQSPPPPRSAPPSLARKPALVSRDSCPPHQRGATTPFPSYAFAQTTDQRDGRPRREEKTWRGDQTAIVSPSSEPRAQKNRFASAPLWLIGETSNLPLPSAR